MPLLTIVIVLIVAGVLLWLINTYIPMDRKIKNILNIVVVIAIVIWLLLVVWATDSGAFFVGRTLKGPRLAPRLSPKKTWSGAIGGGVQSALLLRGFCGPGVGISPRSRLASRTCRRSVA